MTMTMTKTIESFDRLQKANVEIVYPRTYKKLLSLSPEKVYIPRGSGLSFVLASAKEDVQSVCIKGFNRILNFNDSNEVTCEPGVEFGELVNFLIEKNQLIRCIPGYPSISLGGGVAFYSHGKDSFKGSTLEQSVKKIKVFHPQHGEIHCSPNNNSDLFELTKGGMGLTGFITELTLDTLKTQGHHLSREVHTTKGLAETAKIMIECSRDVDFLYSWNQLSPGLKHTPGLIFKEKIVYLSAENTDLSPFRNKFDSEHPFLKFGRLSPRTINKFYYQFNSRIQPKRTLGLSKGLFPSYGSEPLYNSLRRDGFIESQWLIPFSAFESFSADLQNIIDRNQVHPSLVSLKVFRGKRKWLRYTGEGISISILVPLTQMTLKFLEGLDSVSLKHNGLPNLAKDSRISKKTVMQAFGEEYESFKLNINTWDNKYNFNSLLRERLGI